MLKPSASVFPPCPVAPGSINLCQATAICFESYPGEESFVRQGLSVSVFPCAQAGRPASFACVKFAPGTFAGLRHGRGCFTPESTIFAIVRNDQASSNFIKPARWFSAVDKIRKVTRSLVDDPVQIQMMAKGAETMTADGCDPGKSSGPTFRPVTKTMSVIGALGCSSRRNLQMGTATPVAPGTVKCRRI